MLNSGDQSPIQSMPDTSLWTASQLAGLSADALPEIPLLDPTEVAPLIPSLVLWDLWPIQLDDGSLAEVAGGSLWVILSAPRREDPDSRHGIARMRLFHRIGDAWRDCGPLLPDGFSPGSREWSGSTRLDPESGRITLWFTATGRRNEGDEGFEQRLFHAVGVLDCGGDAPTIGGWRELEEALPNDGLRYADTSITRRVPGMIKGFRDPFWFRDPQSGLGYILFTASKPADASRSAHDGVIGIARATDRDGHARFDALPPIIDADGLSNELELPHIVVRDGLYYLFWCAQRQVFAPNGASGPTGLYGMVGEGLFGPYRPLNGTGLVLSNPKDEPRQCYGWRVLPSLDVIGFVDHVGESSVGGARFAGTVAPVVRIEIDGETTRLSG